MNKAFLLVLLLIPGLANAQDAGRYLPEVDPSILTPGFLESHPDLDGRQKGMDLYTRKQYADALSFFIRAAKHADKPSQAMIGEMHWKGEGIAQDKVLGYLWMSIAAERDYEEFRFWRDLYWSKLSAEERIVAQERGQALWEEYGDEVAKRRQEFALARGRGLATGSMLGGTSQLVSILAFKGSRTVGLDQFRFYAKEYWQPNEYWTLQNRMWATPLKGRVDVGDVEQAGTP